MESDGESDDASLSGKDAESRRTFLERAANLTMGGGLAAGYGTLGVCAVRYLYPAEVGRTISQFVCTLDQLQVGESLPYELPSGAKVVVARQQDGNTADAFIALSSVCPHLGCKVHWEAVNNRFFCPCHNGAFDAQGAPTEGPPAAANQHLTRYPLAVEGNLLMIEVPVDAVKVEAAKETA
ncbi:MAG: Rieske (2Fe-2S) protein [Planctomycetaceae bacterium]|nr:Rieske (2Fe-2S) protein [Planctomycetaceae bacterium]